MRISQMRNKELISTYKDEKSVNVVCKIGDHVFVVAQDFFLNEVPSFENDIVL